MKDTDYPPASSDPCAQLDAALMNLASAMHYAGRLVRSDELVQLQSALERLRHNLQMGKELLSYWARAADALERIANALERRSGDLLQEAKS